MRIEEEIGQKAFKSEAQKGIINLIYTTNWVISQQKRAFKSFDITYQQYNILRILKGQHPNASTINLLKDRMLDKMSDASRLVDRLVAKGLIEKKQNKLDRRAADIFITDKGIQLLKDAQPMVEKFSDILSGLTETEIEQLNDLLDKIRS